MYFGILKDHCDVGLDMVWINFFAVKIIHSTVSVHITYILLTSVVMKIAVSKISKRQTVIVSKLIIAK